MECTTMYSEALETLEASWRSLPDKPEESPISTLRALWFCAAGLPKSVSRACEGDLPDLTENQEGFLAELIKWRMAGTPLAYITGWQEFMGIEFISNPAAMIPRKETEILANAVRQVIKNLIHERGKIEILDLCTGSGNLALYLASEFSDCKVIGVDLSTDAVNLARENANLLGLSDRVEFLQGDLFQPFRNQIPTRRFDVIVCNPPYISSSNVKKMPAEISEHEPELAFDGGPFGLFIPWRLVKEAPVFLKPSSWVCFEVGLGQGSRFYSSIQKNPAYQFVQAHMDSQGEIRAFTARTINQSENLLIDTLQRGNHEN
ncbi:MAG: peptide chain release factor N(5)-glutamine methyltransferase [Anaerolineaceae bacterium]